VILEAEAASCFTSRHVLRLDGRPIGMFASSMLAMGFNVELIGRDQLEYRQTGFLKTRCVLADKLTGDELASSRPAGFFSEAISLQLSGGEYELAPARLLSTGYDILFMGRRVGLVRQEGTCRSWIQLNAYEPLPFADALMVLLEFKRRSDAMKNAGGGAGA
jgi:hypothetical protein